MRSKVRAGLVVAIDPVLVDELLDAYEEAKRNFYLGGHRLSAVEGGRFCEAAFRILQQVTIGSFEPLDKSLDAEKTTRGLANLPSGSHSDSVRLYIPRALRVVYDIRNNRDAAHLADGIDPNLQDATLVISVLDWVLAELVRLHHNISPSEAQKMIVGIVTRSAPIIEDFDGFLKVLNPKLPASDHCLVLLYQRGQRGASLEELQKWSRPSMRSNLLRTLRRLVNDKAFIHFAHDTYRITLAGSREVERRGLVQ
jgi:hypothetical protein